MNEEAELLQRFAGDRCQEAFSRLVNRHLGLVFHAALRRTGGDVHLAEDVAQQVFAALARDARRLAGHAHLAGWLYVTTRHIAANVMRSELRRRDRESVSHQLIVNEQGGADADGTWNEIRPVLDAAMDELRPADRDAVLLRFFENQSFARIGATLQVSEDAARMRVDRALERLRTGLARRGIDSTAAALGGAMASQAAGAAPAGLAASVSTAALGGIGAAATATTSSILTQIWTTMSTTKTLAGVAGAIACMGIGAGLYEASGMSPSVRTLEASAATISQLEARLRAEEESRRSAAVMPNSQPEASSTSGGASAQAATPAPSNSGSGARPTPASPVRNQADILFASPEYQRLSVDSYRAGLSLSYGSFYKRIGLSSEKVAAFEDLLVERQQLMVDVMAASRAEGLSLVDVQFKDVGRDTHNEITAKIRDMLGSEAFAQLQEFDRTDASRRYVETLASKLYYTDAPLSLSQADLLTGIIAAQTKFVRSAGMVGSMAETDWDAVMADSGQILSSSQAEVMKQLGLQLRLQREVSVLTQRLMTEALQSNKAAASPPLKSN